MPPQEPARHRTIVVVDVAGFTDQARTLIHQAAVHQGLYEVLTTAFADAGVDLSVCTLEDRGDGALILVPPDVPKSLIAGKLPGMLVAALKQHNSVHSERASVQLRAAFHAGEVLQDAHGVVSQAVNYAFLLIKASQAKAALKESNGVLAVIASDHFYHDVIAQDPAADPGSYRQISVSVMEASARAWLRLPEGTLPTSQVLEADGPIWGNVPPRNPNFIGRAGLLEQMRKRLKAGGAAVLYGMGGVGKTQTTAEYVYRCQADYDLVWWVHATQPAQIRAGLTELAQQLGLPGDSEASTAVPAVLAALSRGDPYRRWLLVFDSVEDPDVVLPFLPVEGPGGVLITSRNPIWSGRVPPLEIGVFSRNESVELLRRHGVEAGKDEASELAETLGDLPLAIEQAAAWGTETGMPVREYMRLFRQNKEILEKSPSGDHDLSVAAAWNVSFDELRARNPTAYQLLEVFAFFAPEPISRSLFTEVHEVSISQELDLALRDPLELGRALRDINRYGFAKIDYESGTQLLHRLVQAVLRNRMIPQRQEEIRHGAHLLVARYDPNDPTSPKYLDVLPHVAALKLIACDDPWVRQLVINLIQFLYISGDHEEAARLATQAVENWSDRLGERIRKSSRRPVTSASTGGRSVSMSRRPGSMSAHSSYVAEFPVRTANRRSRRSSASRST